jgi:hypothetical protein
MYWVNCVLHTNVDIGLGGDKTNQDNPQPDTSTYISVVLTDSRRHHGFCYHFTLKLTLALRGGQEGRCFLKPQTTKQNNRSAAIDNFLKRGRPYHSQISLQSVPICSEPKSCESVPCTHNGITKLPGRESGTKPYAVRFTTPIVTDVLLESDLYQIFQVSNVPKLLLYQWTK